ncbi:Protein of unknown function [Gryllus bimaculatus]|nr:Protein of unknown function [Gryllus bimaculatus]
MFNKLFVKNVARLFALIVSITKFFGKQNFLCLCWGETKHIFIIVLAPHVMVRGESYFSKYEMFSLIYLEEVSSSGCASDRTCFSVLLPFKGKLEKRKKYIYNGYCSHFFIQNFLLFNFQTVLRYVKDDIFCYFRGGGVI